MSLAGEHDHGEVDDRRRRGRWSEVQHSVRLVFLGDWHPALRDPLDIFRLSFVAALVVAWLLGDYHATAQVVLATIVVFGARKLDLPRTFDWGFCLAMGFMAWGNAIHLFAEFWWYDNIVHVLLPAFLAPVIYIALSRLGVVPDPATMGRNTRLTIGIAIVTAALGLSIATLYEVFEWTLDNWFGQHLIISETDTVTDLTDGFIGTAFGGALMAHWATVRYETRRRASELTRRRSRPRRDDR